MMVFDLVGQLVRQISSSPTEAEVSKTTTATSSAGKLWIGDKKVLMKDKGTTLSFQVDTRKQPELAAFLKERLPALLEEFEEISEKEDAQ